MRYRSSRSTTLRDIAALASTVITPFVRRRIVAALALVLVASILTPLGPVALKWIVDAFTGHAAIGIGVPLAIALYVFSQWAARAISETRGLIFARAERRLFTNISDRLFGHVLDLPYRFHAQAATGHIQQSLENGRQGFQIIVHNIVFSVVPVVIQLVTTSWIIWRMAQPLFLAIFCAAVVSYAVAFASFIIRVTKSARNASENNVEASAIVVDSLLNVPTIKYFTAERQVREKVREALTKTEDQWVRFHQGYTANGLVVATIFATFLAAAIMLASREVAAGRMSLGEFVLVNSYMLQLMQPVEMLGYAVQGISQGAAMLEKMMILMREKTEVSLLGGGTPMGRDAAHVTPASLEFRDVSLSYAPGRPALRDVSFQLPAGRVLAIVGPSGSGKTTIGRIVARLIEADGGAVLLDGVDSTEYPLQDWRRQIGVVPQDIVLFNESIGYNIAFGRHGATQEEIERAARVAHLHDFIMSLEQQYGTRVGERGVQLSGGQKQRVSIARAAIKEPRLYVFDEGTSSLDSQTEVEIMQNLRELSRTSTTLIIAHRLSTIVHADEILVMDVVDGAGEIVERGTHAQLLARGGRYTTLHAAQTARAL